MLPCYIVVWQNQESTDVMPKTLRFTSTELAELLHYGWTRSRIHPATSRGAPEGLDSPLPSNSRTMAPKLSSRQQAQLAYLQQLPPKFQRIHSVIEQMAGPRVDEAITRGLGRLLDEIKGKATALSLSGIAETAGIMGTMLRRGGGVQFKVRGLRDLLGSLKSNYEGALRLATTPEEGSEDPDSAS
jgi:hypothetical protein